MGEGRTEVAKTGFFGQSGELLGAAVKKELQRLEEATPCTLVSPEFQARVVKCYRCSLVSSFPELLKNESEYHPVTRDFVTY